MDKAKEKARMILKYDPFWAAESSAVYTVLAVKVLVLSGMLVQEDLEANVKVHAA